MAPKALASASSSPIQSGAFQDAIGTVLASGKLIMDLSQAAAITAGGEVAPRRVAITLDANGFVSAGQVLWANDQLTPTGTVYRMQAYDSNGNFVGDFGYQSITGTAPIDLSLLTPTSIGASVNLAQVVLQAPSANQFITGFPLVMEGVPLGFSAASSTTIDTGISRDSAGVIDIGNGTQGNKTGTIQLKTINIFGATSGSTALNATATASGTLTFPATTDTLVAKATTDNLSNKTLTGASSGNSTTLLNSQDTLGVVTGDGTDKTIYTYTIPANTLGAGKGIRFRVSVTSNNAVVVTYKFKFGGTTVTLGANTAATSNDQFKIEVFNNSGVTNAQTGMFFQVQGNVINGVNTFTAAENTTGSIVATLTANEVAGNTITPKKFFVELIQ